ncbi:TIGR00270 family protein [Candidatus Woesearchaeota archaeon]|nr:TIGR00270 family protein [Candidatus Woesearchaeota archaeon]
MQCEMCGKESPLFLVRIEGTQMNACKTCASFGQILKNPVARAVIPIKKAPPKDEALPVIVTDYAAKIKAAREQKGMTQEELARKLNEKESLMHKMETGSFEPPIALAEKLEKFLNIKLIETAEITTVLNLPKGKTECFTLGDFIKKK